MRVNVSEGRVKVAVALARHEVDGNVTRAVCDVYVWDNGKLVWHDGTLSVPVFREQDTMRRALRDALGFLTAYAWGEYDGPVVDELAPYRDELDALDAEHGEAA